MIDSVRGPTVEEIAGDEASAARRARFDRNLRWFQQHAEEIGACHRGKCICVAGEELFVADAAEAALSLAQAAHPEDDGFFLHYIYKNSGARIYAATWVVA